MENLSLFVLFPDLNLNIHDRLTFTLRVADLHNQKIMKVIVNCDNENIQQIENEIFEQFVVNNGCNIFTNVFIVNPEFYVKLYKIFKFENRQ